MNRLQQNFRKYINEQRLFEPSDRILVSVSGGIDSVVLAHLFAQEHSHWAILHANFRLRGEESDQDEAFVRQLAERYRVKCFSRSFATEQYAQEQQISIQMAARELRREWALSLCSQKQFDGIALAHHHNDQLETLLLNLTKGSGISGLRGMLPKTDVWVRPLLFATREEVVAYAREYQLSWREDHSNAEEKYQRNWIRHRVIPALRKINPSVLTTTQTTVKRLREVEGVFQAEAARLGKKAVNSLGGKVMIQKKILALHPQGVSLLAEWLAPYGFSWADAQQIMSAIQREAQPGLLFLSSGHQLWVEREELVITSRESEVSEISLLHEEGQITRTPLGNLKSRLGKREGYQIKEDPFFVALDYEQLRFPLTLRSWQPGDSFQPLGMTHRKKISDFLIDTKVPRHQKNRVLVLLSAGEIAWVVGYRVDHRFRLTEQTRTVYEISWQPAKV